MGKKVEDFMNLCERNRVASAERKRMGRAVRGNSFNAVQHQLLQISTLPCPR